MWAAAEAWGSGGDIALNVPVADERGSSVTALRVGGGHGARLRKWCDTNAGVTLGIPLGMALPDESAYGDYLRIGHMGHVNAHMVLGVLSVMEAGMKALGIPHGAGALDSATLVVSQA